MSARQELTGDFGHIVVDLAGPFVTLSVRSPLSAASGAVELTPEQVGDLRAMLSDASLALTAKEPKPAPRPPPVKLRGAR